MALVSMWPPANGALNTISFEGRTYSSTPGNFTSVQDFDVGIMQANGWTTTATVAGQNYVNLTPPASHNSIIFNGRSYSTPPGTTIHVPLFDVGVLQANGWTPVYQITLQSLSIGAPGAFQVGDAGGTVIGQIIGATPGSTITVTAQSVAGAVTVSGTNLVVGTAPGAAQTISGITLHEVLSGATNTPNDTTGLSVVELVAIPTNSVLPSISGAAQVGQTLTVTTGTWTGSPSSYAYKWKSAGSPVGTNANTYVPVTGDIGNTITVSVTATNAGGSSAPATSAATSSVIAGGGSSAGLKINLNMQIGMLPIAA